MKLLLSIVDATCARLLEMWRVAAESGEDIDDRDLAFPLFALSRLGVTNEDFFASASEKLVWKLRMAASTPGASCRPVRVVRSCARPKARSGEGR